ncbi:unnamed protein product [Bathycoccus prasinos]
MTKERENRNNEQLVVDENDDDDEEELEPPHEVITYVDQKALLRKQNFRNRRDDDANATTNNTNKRRKDGGEKERMIKMMNLDVNEGFQMGFQDPPSGFGLWGGGNESLEATATMTTPMAKNTTNNNSLDDEFERRTSPRARKTASSAVVRATGTTNNDNTTAVTVRRSPRKHRESMDGPSTQTVSSPSGGAANNKNKKRKTTTTTAQTTQVTKAFTNNQRKKSAKDANATSAPSKRGKITTTKTTAARGGRQSQQASVRKTALVMTSTQQQPSQQLPSSNRGTLPTTMQRVQQNKPTKQKTGGTGRKDNNINAPKALPLTTRGGGDGGQGGIQLPRATSKMPTSTRDKVLGVVKPVPVIEKVRYDCKKNSSLDGTQSSLGNGTEEIEDDIEDDIIDSGDDGDGGEDETNIDVVASPKNAVTTTQRNDTGNDDDDDDDGAPPIHHTQKQGEAGGKEEKEKKKVTSFLPKLASPTNDLFLDGVGGGGKKSKRGTEFTGSGPKARLKRALQKLKINKLRFEENVKKNRLEYDEGSSGENGITFHVRSVTMERGVFRCFGYAKPMHRKKTEAEVIGDILDEEDEEENVEEDEEDFLKKRKEKKELRDLLDDNGEYDVTVLFTKELQKDLNVSIGNRVEIFQPFREVLARNAFGETARCIVRADFCQVLDGN